MELNSGTDTELDQSRVLSLLLASSRSAASFTGCNTSDTAQAFGNADFGASLTIAAVTLCTPVSPQPLI
jgi:hypothetical protein